MSKTTSPYLGFGLGLRIDHYETILEQLPREVDWLEIISENFMVEGGKPLYYLDRVREHYPLVMHGVSLSLGSSDPLDRDYLKALKTLADRIDPPWFSDHLCWTGVHGRKLHDLLPLPYSDRTIRHVADRIREVQDFMQRPMIIENVSSYVSFKQSKMPEWEFLCAVVERADCGILLDVNNIYVSAFNHEFDPLEYLNTIPAERVCQIHLAGHLNRGDIIIDTHDHPIVDSVWDLHRAAVQRFGAVSTMIERDDNIPPLEELLQELGEARKIAAPIVERHREEQAA
ncbi:MAG: DUF692 domain-containing protein [Pseudomonadota bacterium]|nr:DUF692 domain-containing protein [Pseudomonadota bacterium]